MQLEPHTIIYILLGISGAIAGTYIAIIAVYRWAGRHTSDQSIHPAAERVVYRDLCEERSRRFEDCLEGEVKNFNSRMTAVENRLTDLKADMQAGLGEIKTLIKNGHK